MRKSGFTLVELIIVVIIIGILGVLSLPQYMSSLERARAGKARASMVLIAKAENMRAADNNGIYIACANNQLIANLGSYVEMDEVEADTAWDYAVALGGGPATFIITATKQAGLPNAGETITLDQFGVWGGTFTPD
jgi:prepilin-type N-terminal cleavage/methylation domain-containing protein